MSRLKNYFTKSENIWKREIVSKASLFLRDFFLSSYHISTINSKVQSRVARSHTFTHTRILEHSAPLHNSNPEEESKSEPGLLLCQLLPAVIRSIRNISQREYSGLFPKLNTWRKC